MKRLWKFVNQKSWRAETKFLAASLILGVLFALLGYGLWLAIRPWIFSTRSWMICFAGYPAVFAWVYVFSILLATISAAAAVMPLQFQEMKQVHPKRQLTDIRSALFSAAFYRRILSFFRPPTGTAFCFIRTGR